MTRLTKFHSVEIRLIICIAHVVGWVLWYFILDILDHQNSSMFVCWFIHLIKIPFIGSGLFILSPFYPHPCWSVWYPCEWKRKSLLPFWSQFIENPLILRFIGIRVIRVWNLFYCSTHVGVELEPQFFLRLKTPPTSYSMLHLFHFSQAIHWLHPRNK
jgi:hypothetical protein